MRAAHHQMKRVFECHCVSLHVRVSNRAAFALYKDVLGYEVRDIDKAYYADKEDAYDMRLTFKSQDESKADEIDNTGKEVADQYAETNHNAADKKNSTPVQEESKEENAQAIKNKKKRNKKKKGKQGKEEEKEEVEQNTK